MDLAALDWGSPVGLGIFFAGFGIFLWGAQFARRWTKRP
jgi:hypothetical protein